MFKPRLAYLRAAINRPLPAFLIVLVSILGFFDTLSDHLIPPSVFKFPKLWEIARDITNALPDMPPWGWLAVLSVMLALITFEYSFRASNRIGLDIVGRSSPVPVSIPIPDAPVSLRLTPARRSARDARHYAPPEDAKDLDITTMTNKELGRLLESIGRSAAKFRRSIPYNETEENIVSQFHKKIGHSILWVYEEARKRDVTDSTIESYYGDQEGFSVSQI